MMMQEAVEHRVFVPAKHAATEAGNSVGKAAEREEEEGEKIPLELVAKFKRLQGSDLKWYSFLPTPFLLLIVFCVGFAAVSIASLAAVAILTHDSEDQYEGDGSSAIDGPVPSDPVSSSVLLGIGVLSSVVGSLQTASGYCAQRIGHQLDALSERFADRPTRRHPLFFIGLLLLVCGTIAAVVNLGILGQSVTAPFAAMTLIFNGCLASTVLHEVITNYDIIATVLVLFGVGIAMLGVGLAELDPQVFVLADIEANFMRSAFPAVYSVVLLGSLAAFYLAVKKRGWQCKPAGLCCFSVGAGVLSGFSSLCVKCTVEVLKGVVQHHSGDLTNPVLYLFIAGIPVFVLSQLRLMTLGLEHFGTFKFVPPYHAFIILSNLVNGMVYFDEAKGYDLQASCFFLSGCIFTVAGVFVLLAKSPEDTRTEKTRDSRLSDAPTIGESDIEQPSPVLEQ